VKNTSFVGLRLQVCVGCNSIYSYNLGVLEKNTSTPICELLSISLFQ